MKEDNLTNPASSPWFLLAPFQDKTHSKSSLPNPTQKSSARMDLDQSMQKPSCLVKIETHNFKNQLQLPAAFIDFFNDDIEIPKYIVLKRKSSVKGRCYIVDLVKIANRYLLCGAGWSVFVSDFALKFEDRILFEYSGDSQFLFRVYDNTTGKPKGLVSSGNIAESITLPTGSDVQNKVNVEQMDEDEPRNVSDQEDGDRSCDSVSSDSEFAPTIAMGGKAGVKKVMQTFVSEHPFFAVSLTKSYINRGRMFIPETFGNKYLPKTKKTFELKIGSNRDADSWKVDMWHCQTKKTPNYWSFGTGWKQCVKDNGLQEGDICVFELIERDGAKMQMSILRL